MDGEEQKPREMIPGLHFEGLAEEAVYSLCSPSKLENPTVQRPDISLDVTEGQ